MQGLMLGHGSYGEKLTAERELLTGLHLPESGRRSQDLPSTPSLTLLSVVSLANQFLQSSLPYQTLCSRLRSRRGVTSSLMEMSSEWKERKQLPDLDVIIRSRSYADGISDCRQSVCALKIDIVGRDSTRGSCILQDVCAMSSTETYHHPSAFSKISRIDAVGQGIRFELQ